MIMTIYAAEKSVPESLGIQDNMTYFGGLSQYYSKGLIYVDSSAAPTPVNTNSHSQLYSSIQITGRKRSESTETQAGFS